MAAGPHFGYCVLPRCPSAIGIRCWIKRFPYLCCPVCGGQGVGVGPCVRARALVWYISVYLFLVCLCICKMRLCRSNLIVAFLFCLFFCQSLSVFPPAPSPSWRRGPCRPCRGSAVTCKHVLNSTSTCPAAARRVAGNNSGAQANKYRRGRERGQGSAK